MAETGIHTMQFKAGQRLFTFPRPCIIMGVLNLTPDSFSDGGKYHDLADAVNGAHQLVQEGAEIIDLGGESTRPNATPVSEQEELRRVMPVLEKLAGNIAAIVSIDTQKPAVARAALAGGASIINDIATNRSHPEMWEIAAEAGAGYIAMHMQGTPQTMQSAPAYEDVVKEVEVFFTDRLAMMAQAGLAAEQIALDVGIGFGKKAQHNLTLLAKLKTFEKFGRPLLLGVSRKSFLGAATGLPVTERLPAALGCSAWAVLNGANIIRTHDVAPTLQSVRMIESILAHDRC